MCIRTICRVGFSPTKEQIKDIVQQYVKLHHIRKLFKNEHPGKGMDQRFHEQKQTIAKIGTTISSVRKSATRNPFIVHNCFNFIESIISKQNIPLHNTWNCDGSGFPHDSSKFWVISIKGEIAYKLHLALTKTIVVL